MTQDKIKRIHRFYSWGLAVILVVIGVLMIWSCLDIYGGVKGSYSPEAIALRFRRIAIPICIGIAGIVGNIILNLFLPLSSKRAKSLITPREAMLRMRQKVSTPPVQKEMRFRLGLTIVTAVFFIGLMSIPAAYFIRPGHFATDDPNRDVLIATLFTLIPTLNGLVLCWYCHLLLNESYRRETAVYKQALVDGQRAKKTENVNTKRSFNMRWVQIPLVAVAAILIILGVINKGASDVLVKAVVICTECIGIG